MLGDCYSAPAGPRESIRPSSVRHSPQTGRSHIREREPSEVPSHNLRGNELRDSDGCGSGRRCRCASTVDYRSSCDSPVLMQQDEEERNSGCRAAYPLPHADLGVHLAVLAAPLNLTRFGNPEPRVCSGAFCCPGL